MTTKTFYAVAKAKGTNATEVIEHNGYSTKAAFKEDLKLNGFTVKFIAGESDHKKALENVKRFGYLNISQKDDVILSIFEGKY